MHVTPCSRLESKRASADLKYKNWALDTLKYGPVSKTDDEINHAFRHVLQAKFMNQWYLSPFILLKFFT